MQSIIDNLSSIAGLIMTLIGLVAPLISFFILSKYRLKLIESDIRDIKEQMKLLSDITFIKQKQKEFDERMDKHEEEQKTDIKEIKDLLYKMDRDQVEISTKIKQWNI